MGTLFTILKWGDNAMLTQYLVEFIPFVIIAIGALILGILNYRTNKKILKKLEGIEHK